LQYADDFRFHPDPAMIFEVPKDGDYTVEIRDVLYRGRGDLIYRLSIGQLPFITDIFPLGGPRNADTQVELRGVNLPFKTLKVPVPADSPRVRMVNVTANGWVSNSLPFATSDIPELLEVEPNDTQAQAQKVEIPSIINGRIQKSGDVDYYSFTAKAGQKIVMEVRARRLMSPLDSIITVFNARGDMLVENDDWTDPSEALITHHADSRLVYTIPANGNYFLRIRDIQSNGGDAYAYRLTIAPPRQDFALRITPDNPRLGQGDTAAITVTAMRIDGFDGEIDLSVEGLPKGFTATQAVIPPGQDTGRLTITAPLDAKVGILAPAVLGKAKAGEETITRKAEAAESVMQAFAYTFNIPAKQLFLAVIPPSAYSLAAKVDAGKVLEVRPDTETQIVVKVNRKENALKNSVFFAVLRPAPGISLNSVNCPPDKDEATITLTVAKEAKIGLVQNIILSAAMRTPKETITRFAPAFAIKVVAPPATQ
jgi:hypothetical protein